MQHSAGLSDHADDAYVRDVLADLAHAWTRGEQLRRYTSQPCPIGPPGAKFQYSDTGYVLLGEIIERAAGDSLAAVARREQGFDRLGLATTWWGNRRACAGGRCAARAPVPGQAGRDRRQRHDGSLWRRRTGHVGARSGALDRRSVRRPRLRTPRHAGRDAGAWRPRGRDGYRLGLFAAHRRRRGVFPPGLLGHGGLLLPGAAAGDGGLHRETRDADGNAGRDGKRAGNRAARSRSFLNTPAPLA